MFSFKTIKKIFSSCTILINNVKGDIKNKNKLIIKLNSKFYCLDKTFVDWLVRFSYAEAKFNITLRNLKDNKYDSLNVNFSNRPSYC